MPTELMTEKYLQAQREAEANGEQPAPQPLSDFEPPKSQSLSWSKGLTVTCVLFLIIGLIGGTASVYEIQNLMADPEVAIKEIRNNRDLRRDQRSQLIKMEKQSQETKEKFMPVLMSLSGAKFVIASCFLMGIFLMIGRARFTPKYIIGLCGAAMLFHVATFALAMLLVREAAPEINAVMNKAFNQAARQEGLTKSEQEQVKETATNVIATVFTVGLGFVFLVRIIFYGSIIAYFCQHEIRAIFGDDPLAYLRRQNYDEAALA